MATPWTAEHVAKGRHGRHSGVVTLCQAAPRTDDRSGNGAKPRSSAAIRGAWATRAGVFRSFTWSPDNAHRAHPCVCGCQRALIGTCCRRAETSSFARGWVLRVPSRGVVDRPDPAAAGCVEQLVAAAVEQREGQGLLARFFHVVLRRPLTNGGPAASVGHAGHGNYLPISSRGEGLRQFVAITTFVDVRAARGIRTLPIP